MSKRRNKNQIAYEEKISKYLNRKAKSLDVNKLKSLMKNAKMETLILETEARLYQVQLLIKRINKHKDRKPTSIIRVGQPNNRGTHEGDYNPQHYPEIMPKLWSY